MTIRPRDEQEQFDEVKDIEAQAATKAPYKGSYTATRQRNQDHSKGNQEQRARNDDQTARQQASNTNTSNWKSTATTSTTRRTAKQRPQQRKTAPTQLQEPTTATKVQAQAAHRGHRPEGRVPHQDCREDRRVGQGTRASQRHRGRQQDQGR